jgi:hypothetical protein
MPVVIGAVGDVTALVPQNPSPTWNDGKGGTPVVAIVPIGGLNSAVIGVSPNENNEPASNFFTGTQAQDHFSELMGAIVYIDNDKDQPEKNPDINIGGVAVNVFDDGVSTGEFIRYSVATAGPVIFGGAFPNTYLNRTDPEATVVDEGGCFAVSPP